LEGTASYGFQETKDRITDRLLSNSPRHLITFSLTQPLFRRKLFISVNGGYRGRVETLTGDSVSRSSTVNLTFFGRRLSRHLDLSASAYNLLDNKNLDPGAGETRQPAIALDGRNFRVKLSWRLGER